MWLKTANIDKTAPRHWQNGWPTWLNFVNIANERAHWPSSIDGGNIFVWISGHIVGLAGSNRRLPGCWLQRDDCTLLQRVSELDSASMKRIYERYVFVPLDGRNFRIFYALAKKKTIAEEWTSKVMVQHMWINNVRLYILTNAIP
jgi:hypothetical protein